MVSLRKRRLRNPSPPAASDRIPELEPIIVRNTKDLRSDRSLGQSSLDDESEKNSARRSEDLVAPTFPVTARKRRTPVDYLEPRVMKRSSILARSRAAEVRLLSDLNQRPRMDSQLHDGLREHAITALPAGDAISHEDEDTGDNPVVAEGELERNAPEVTSSGRSLQARYVDRRESPSVSSRRRRREIKRAKSNASPECQLIDSSTQPKKYNTRRALLHPTQSVDNVERSAPGAGSSGRYLRSSTVNEEPVHEGEEAPGEEPLLHAVYYMVLVSGGDGISQEEVLVDLHGQLPPATLAHTDWEADVKQCLKSRWFVQEQGQFVLRKHCHDRLNSSAGKETTSHSCGKSGLKGRKKSKKDKVKGSMSMSKIKDHGLGNRGSLKALQQKIEEEQGIPKGARQCSLTKIPCKGRKFLWKCPLMAMEDDKLCEHHRKKAQETRAARMKT